MNVRLAERNDIEAICGLYHEFFVFNAEQQPESYRKAIETGTYPQSVMNSKAEDLFVPLMAIGSSDCFTCQKKQHHCLTAMCSTGSPRLSIYSSKKSFVKRVQENCFLNRQKLGQNHATWII